MTQPLPTTAVDHASRPRVLVIDDDPQVRNLVVAFLRRDYLVAVASDGEEGYQKALEHQPDIAVIDIQMEGWDGLKTLKAFREHATLRQVRTVMLTADTSRQTVLAAIAIGADDYIVKTALARDDLLQKLIRVRQNPVSTRPATSPRLLPGESTADALVGAGNKELLAPQSEQMGLGTHSLPQTEPQSPQTPPTVEGDSSPPLDPRELQAILDAWE